MYLAGPWSRQVSVLESLFKSGLPVLPSALLFQHCASLAKSFLVLESSFHLWKGGVRLDLLTPWWLLGLWSHLSFSLSGKQFGPAGPYLPLYSPGGGISTIAKGNLGQVQYSGLKECSLKLWGMLQAWGKDIWKNSKCSSCFYGWKMAKRESVVPSNCCPWDPECWSKVKPEELTLGPFHGPYTPLPCCSLGFRAVWSQWKDGLCILCAKLISRKGRSPFLLQVCLPIKSLKILV